MKEIIARATIRTDKYVNTGFLHIKDNFAQGAFTLDYVEISIKKKQMVLNLSEENLDFENDKTSVSHLVYKNPFPYDKFTFFETYFLYDSNKNFLTLTIDSIETDPYETSKILELINQCKENSIF